MGLLILDEFLRDFWHMAVKHGLLHIFVVKVLIYSVIPICFELTVVPEFIEIVLVDDAQVIADKQSLILVLLLVLVGFGVVWPAVVLQTERHSDQVFKPAVDLGVLPVVGIDLVEADHSIGGGNHQLF